ncbi:MAG: hypothetical protein ACI83H_002263 [Glaciecola sp.]|jgi:hypothetical protein
MKIIYTLPKGLNELTNGLWDKYKEGQYEKAYYKTKKWFNNRTVKYNGLLFLLAISNAANKSIGARLFWKNFVYGHRYDIYGNKIYQDIRQDFSVRWEELIYNGYEDIQSFWNVFYKDLRWKKPYRRDESVGLHIKGQKWSNYIEFIGDIDKAKFNEHYKHIRYYIEDFEKDGYSTKQESSIYFAKECLSYHLRNTLEQTIDEFIKEGRIELFEGRWINEFNLYLGLKKYFQDYSIIYQASPSFLDGQIFDVWIHEMKVAIEYNGLQNYEPVDFFGGEEGFKDTLIRDENKRKKCKKNKVKMIEIKEGYDFKKLIEQIEAN